MPWHKKWRNVFRPKDLDREIEAELRFHLAETADRLMAEGMPEADALRAARLKLGNFGVQKENTRDVNVSEWLDALRADLVYAWRQLRSARGFTAVAILSLALGIGANTAIFQLIDAVRLKMLPVLKPGELVSIDFAQNATRPGSWYGFDATMTYAQWEQVRAHDQPFTGAVTWSPDRFNLANGGEIRLAEGLYVSGNFFRVLGVGSVLGRTFTTEDDDQRCNLGAVVSYAFWQREFGGDSDVVGRTLSLDGHSVPVIGVTPASFFGLKVGKRYDVAVPICADRILTKNNPSRISMPAAWWLSAMGRLKPGWTVQKAAAYLHSVSPEIMRATLPAGYRPDVAKSFLQNRLTAKAAGTGLSDLREQYERPLWVLLGISSAVLLIACANLANLLLARATVREREIAIRLAMGASRWRVTRQLLIETLLLAVTGAAAGAILAIGASRGLLKFISTSNDPLFVNLAPDWRMLTFTATLSLATCLLFGLLPALRAGYSSPGSAMRTVNRSFTTGRAQVSARRTLVSVQVALSMMLLFGAILFARSLNNLLQVDAGFHPDGLLAINMDLSKAPIPEERRPALYRDLTDRLSALPGVVSAAQVSFTPVSGGIWNNLVAGDAASAANGKLSYFNAAGPGYFKTMRTRLLMGRDFNERDTLSSPKVAIVNEMFARTFFRGANPVGHIFHMAADAGAAEPAFRIIGLVENTKYGDLRENFKPIAFFPISQLATGAETTFVLRTSRSSAQVFNEVRTTVMKANPLIGIEFRSLTAQLQDSLLRERLMAMLSEGFALLAALLATLGMYGVIAYMVAQRRKEIGVRIALGAERGGVIRLVLGEAVLLLCFGLAVGFALTLCAGKAAASLLFGLQAYDPPSLFGAGGMLAVIALLASYVPARRAARVDALEALRYE